MDEQTWQGIQYLGNSVNASVGMIQAADLSRKNREFYNEQYRIQREYNTQERLAAQEYNTQEREAAQAWNEQMWNATNAYNAPSAQMERMMAAGINPNNAAMAIGQNSVSASAPSSSPMSSPSASVSPPGMPEQYNPAQAMASMLNANANAQAAFSQSRLNNAVAEKTAEETVGLVIDNKYKPFEKDADIESAYAKIDLMAKNGELDAAQAQNIRELMPLLKGKTIAETNKLFNDAAVASAQLGQIQKNISLISEQIQTEKHRQSQLDAAAYEAYMNAEESNSNIQFNGVRMTVSTAEARLKDLEADEQHLKNEWRKHCQSLGYDPDSSHIDRLIDEAGSNIRLFQNVGSQLLDSAKLRLNGAINFFGDAFDSAASAVSNGSSWSRTWDE